MSRKKFFRRLAALEGRSLADPDAPPDINQVARRIAYIFATAKCISAGTFTTGTAADDEELLVVAERIFELLYPTTEKEPQCP